jgi:choline dehydrogenase-like flavoprotein
MGRVAIVGSGPTGIGAAEVLVGAGIGVDVTDGGSDLDSALAKGEVRAARGAGADQDGGLLSRVLRTLGGELPATLLHKQVFDSDFAFAGIERGIPLEGPWLPRSLARGGLANVWGAACYALRADDYADWPVEPELLRPWLGAASRLLHVSGSHDGLSAAYEPQETMTVVAPGEGHDPGSPFEVLLSTWDSRREALADAGLHAGRARLAVRPRAGGGPGACEACGRCLEGCPVEAIWNGRQALGDLVERGVRHLRGRLVRRWRTEDGALWLECGMPGEAGTRTGPYDAVFLAAGPLSSFRIAAQSVGEGGPATARLSENDVFVLPFFLPRGMTHGERRFTLSEAAIAIDPRGALERPAHLQLYRPGGSTLGPLSALIERMPAPIRRLALAGIGRLALGMLYLHGAQSRGLSLRLRSDDAVIAPIEVAPEDAGRSRPAVREAIRRLHAARRSLALYPLALAVRRGGPGFSAHLGCTLPIRRRPGRLECDGEGRLAGSTDGAPVFVVDLSSFPEMPAQNPTLAGVANAMRIAAHYAATGR